MKMVNKSWQLNILNICGTVVGRVWGLLTKVAKKEGQKFFMTPDAPLLIGCLNSISDGIAPYFRTKLIGHSINSNCLMNIRAFIRDNQTKCEPYVSIDQYYFIGY